MVGEIKKERYVYYHCIGYADKCQGSPVSCRRHYVREEVLEWVRDALHASHADERREHEEVIKRHQAEYKPLQDRINAMYVDKLDGLVDTTFFEKMSTQWREEQNRCVREINRHQNADKSYKDEGVALLDLARNAQRPRKTPLAEFHTIELHLGVPIARLPRRRRRCEEKPRARGDRESRGQ